MKLYTGVTVIQYLIAQDYLCLTFYCYEKYVTSDLLITKLGIHRYEINILKYHISFIVPGGQSRTNDYKTTVIY